MIVFRKLIGRLAFFFCAKIKIEGDENMFSDELLEKFFSDEEIRKCPVGTQSTIIHSIEKILEQEGYNLGSNVSKSTNNGYGYEL